MTPNQLLTLAESESPNVYNKVKELIDNKCYIHAENIIIASLLNRY